jgi:hypothetical protein
MPGRERQHRRVEVEADYVDAGGGEPERDSSSTGSKFEARAWRVLGHVEPEGDVLIGATEDVGAFPLVQARR